MADDSEESKSTEYSAATADMIEMHLTAGRLEVATAAKAAQRLVETLCQVWTRAQAGSRCYHCFLTRRACQSIAFPAFANSLN